MLDFMHEIFKLFEFIIVVSLSIMFLGGLVEGWKNADDERERQRARYRARKRSDQT